MKIYFGRVPQGDRIIFLNAIFRGMLIENDYNLETTVDKIVCYLEGESSKVIHQPIFHTSNPLLLLLLNYFPDDFAKDYVWIIDEEGNHIKFGDDENMLSKLSGVVG